ncbi:DUF2000 family protein [Roseibium suaedae]|uniref:DUF2000 family protein n=1 Tax=Roseibium suaedae TaxID=735517 RepID=A0A1M7CSR8_9HYPH|nr:DUF2000 family protein [Roseibium suaedae]SHL70255.1 hypothetical protein SAMN05444272_1263 [Roseibium suaedae]
MFDTKFVITVREDLATWQKLNVTAFLATGVSAGTLGLIGEPYKDAAGHDYYAICRQPIIVLSADAAGMDKIQERALSRGVDAALYIDDMFSTSHDAANREVFSKCAPGTARIAGIAFHADKKLADKITKGAKMHP